MAEKSGPIEVYALWMKQRGEGCDYTIGCGTRVQPLTSHNEEDARREAEALIGEFTGERELEAAFLVRHVYGFNTDAIYANLNREARNATERVAKEKRQREYEKLKQEFGGAP